jgi:hypothetical protein
MVLLTLTLIVRNNIVTSQYMSYAADVAWSIANRGVPNLYLCSLDGYQESPLSGTSACDVVVHCGSYVMMLQQRSTTHSTKRLSMILSILRHMLTPALRFADMKTFSSS